MQRETWSIIGACALGALTGAFVALDIASRFQYGSYFWSVGALIGGMVAYVAADFRQFCAGVVHSYRRTITWRPYYLYWQALFAQWIGMCAATTSVIVVLVLSILVTKGFGWLDALHEGAWSVTTIMCAAIVFNLAIVWIGLPDRFRFAYNSEYESCLRHEITSGYNIARKANPLGVMYHLLKGLWWLVLHSPSLCTQLISFITRAAMLLAQFVAGVFVHIHSKRRTLCFVDASLGAAIGYAFGSALVGGFAGAVLGVINYEFVSVRWLKLAARTTE